MPALSLLWVRAGALRELTFSGWKGGSERAEELSTLSLSPSPVEAGEGNVLSPTPEPSSIQGNAASWACLAWQPPNPSQPVTNPQGGKREGFEGRGGLASRSKRSH